MSSLTLRTWKEITFDPERDKWARRAACRDYPHKNDFFPDLAGNNLEGREAKERALAICATCTVTDQCLAFGVEANADGIWGGTTFRERARMR